MNNVLKSSYEAAKTAYLALDDKLGKDIVALDISDITIIADYFIICSANNVNHLSALADEVEKQLTENGFKLMHREGRQASGWILLDFGGIIIHLFGKDEREFYNLERIWADAKFVSF